jgi:predicted ATPase
MHAMSKNRISIQNFRVFKEMTDFEIRPLTLLIGPNNSGKSSFTKLILAFKNDLRNIKFNEKEEHNLESFPKILNWSSGLDQIVLRPFYRAPFLSNNFSYEITYKNNTIHSIALLNILDDKEVMSFKRVDLQPDDDVEDYNHFDELLLNFDINFLIDLIYDKQVYFKKGLLIGDNTDFNTLKNEARSNDDFIDELEDQFKDLENDMSSLVQDYLLFDVFRENNNITSFYKEQIIEHQNSIIKKGFTRYMHYDEIISSSSVIKLKNDFIGYLKKQLKKELEIDLDLDNLELKYSKLGALMFSKDSIIQEEIKKLLNDFPSSILSSQPIYYISANRGSQKRVLQNTSENQINEIIVDYSLLKNPDLVYLREILQIFDIEGELVVERFENTISSVYLLQNDRKINLADLGFGYSQIIPIFLKIIIATKKSEANGAASNNPMSLDYLLGITVIIEEPEANLHPNLQAKFADFLALTLKKFPKINFIVETHSEYLLRKLQFLTAKGDLTTNDTVIHYFNKDKYVSIKEPKVKEIFIDEFGGLSDTFGPGFFDEATDLKFQLMKLNQAQRN